MKLSARALAIKPSPITQIFERAAQMRAQGRDIVDLSVGEPDFLTPTHIREAGKLAIDTGKTRYTAVDGKAAAKDAVIGKFWRENGLKFARDEIVIGSGAKPVLAVAVMAAVGEGDEVILPTPCWPSHLAMIELAGATPILVPCPIEEGYKLTAERLQNAISEKTRLLILSSPANPTGAVYGANELLALSEILRKNPDIAVISDDLYEHICFDDTKFTTLAKIAPDLGERVLTVNGVSKAYAMTGWRMGYAAGPKNWTRAIAGIFSQGEGSPSEIGQEAGIAALEGDQAFLLEWRKNYQKRRDIFCNILAQNNRFRLRKPEGAFYVYVGLDGLQTRSAIDFCAHALDNGVAVTPAEAFCSKDAFRASIANSDENIEKGAKRLLNSIQEFADK